MDGYDRARPSSARRRFPGGLPGPAESSLASAPRRTAAVDARGLRVARANVAATSMPINASLGRGSRADRFLAPGAHTRRLPALVRRKESTLDAERVFE